jgi:predicted aminopeptidase
VATSRSRGPKPSRAGCARAATTLGRFADPLLSTVVDYPDADVAAIIFHELAHQLLYVPGDSQFNESFAETVEEAGLARWLAAGGRAAELARFERRRREAQAFVAVFVRGRERLRALYLEPLPVGVMRARKAEVLADIAAQVRALERELGVHSGYDDWLEAGLDNARLASVGTYFDCVPGFERLLAAEGDELPRFYAAVRALARRPRAERDALCTA